MHGESGPRVLDLGRMTAHLAAGGPALTDRLILSPLSEADAAEIAAWRYPPPYDFYNGSEVEIAVMVDPSNDYRAVRFGAVLVGFLCCGPDARVAGQRAVAGVDDVGWGFAPALTGRGLAGAWAQAGVDALAAESSAGTQRVVIATWNGRSLAVARRCGFSRPVSLVNAAGHWTILTRSIPERGRR